MKKALLVLGLITSLFTHSAVADISGGLAWDASPSPGVTQYIVYTAMLPSAPWPEGWTVLGTVPATRLSFTPVVFDGLPHAYLVTAKGLFESDPSNIVTAPEKPSAPLVLRVTIP